MDNLKKSFLHGVLKWSNSAYATVTGKIVSKFYLLSRYDFILLGGFVAGLE